MGASQRRDKIPHKLFVIQGILLLLVVTPEVQPSSLTTINPWLSACDISQPLPPDIQGICTVNPRLYYKKMMQRSRRLQACPRSCPVSQFSSDRQCLSYLDESRKNAICHFSPTPGKIWLKQFLARIRLRHCCEHSIIESLSGRLLDIVLKGDEECFQVIDNLENVDNLAARVTCEFTEVLSRFDCNHPYSVQYSCEDCKEAYRRWVCMSLVPYFNGTRRIRPCRSSCQIVEQKCPYFLPENRSPSLPTQYAGEPTFLCLDPNIPETGEQQENSIHPEDETCCIKPCGTPYEGLCYNEGTRCENTTSYENATLADCNATEAILARAAVERCPLPSLHPKATGSTLLVNTSHPFLLILSTFLTLQASHSHSYFHLLLLLFFLVVAPLFSLYFSSFGIFKLLACFYFVTSPFIPTIFIIKV